MDEKDEVVTYVKVCADCGSKKILVRDSRAQSDGSVRRRKVCSDCGFEFWTVEVEECIFDLGGSALEIETLKRENEALKKRIRLIKAITVRDI